MGTPLDSTFNATKIADDQHVDVVKLQETIHCCYLMNRDGRYTPKQQGNYLAHARVLRDELKVLQDKFFETGIAEVREANKKIAEVNGDAKKALVKIEHSAETIENLGELAHQLSNLIKIVGLVV
jgi:hypothetical protein